MQIEKEKSIFFHAIGIESPDDREVYLRQACGDDQGLLAGIHSLLRENDREENPLDHPPAEFLLRSLSDGGAINSGFRQYAAGDVIGPYRLLEQIGEGGFGLVFVADQQLPVRRRVAVKIIKPEFASGQTAARFEAERQALAMMDHVNIARVFDGGVTDFGHSYFVMELVRGVRLDEFCDHHKLSLEERLELFVSICHAVQHAHQKGVIHRDLKPSNILVTLQDGRPLPKVIDFGLVKAVSGNLIEQTIYTRFSAMMGTPAYMSPEQAEMSHGDIDTRSDVYSLGVILYEFLSGVQPFADDRLKEASFDELRRIIREEDPPRPSVRLSTLGAQLNSTVSTNRRVESLQLKSLVRGDLDCIAMKALDKDRNRRYSSAESLAADVCRYLKGETVEARPTTHWYRFSKFARRHKFVLFMVSAVAVCMIMATSISIWQARRALAAMEAARTSEREATQARQEVESYVQRLKKANSLLVLGESCVQSGDWARAHSAFTAATQILPEYFSVWVERGSLLAKLGLWDAALADYSRAIELGSPVAGIEFQGVSSLLNYFGMQKDCREMAVQLAQAQGGFPGTKLRGQLCSDLSMEQIREVAAQCDKLVEDQLLLPSGEPARSTLMPLGVRYYLSGWAHLRARNYEQAIERFKQSHTDVPGWKGEGIAHPLLARAYFESGHIPEAKQALLTSEKLLDKWLNDSVGDLNGAPPMAWFAWMEFLQQYRAVYEMINGEPAPIDPRFGQQRRKALEVLEAGISLE